MATICGIMKLPIDDTAAAAELRAVATAATPSASGTADSSMRAPARISKGRNQRPADDEVSDPRARALEEEDEFRETDKSPVSVAKKAPAKPGKVAKPGPGGLGGLPVSPKVLIIAGAAVVRLAGSVRVGLEADITIGSSVGG